MKVYAFVHEEDGSFGISFPDFPGCISTGDTLEATKNNGLEALLLHCDTMRELNKPLCSEPLSYDEIITSKRFDEQGDGATIIAIEINMGHEAA